MLLYRQNILHFWNIITTLTFVYTREFYLQHVLLFTQIIQYMYIHMWFHPALKFQHDRFLLLCIKCWDSRWWTVDLSKYTEFFTKINLRNIESRWGFIIGLHK